MKKSIIYLIASSFILINCGSESKANSVNEVITEIEKNIEKEIIKTDSTNNEIIETVTTESNKITEAKTIEKVPSEKISNEEKTLINANINQEEDLSHLTQETIEAVREESIEMIPTHFNHQIFDALLKKYVTSSGKVNYKGIKSESDKLKAYIKELQNEYVNINTWSKNKKLAFWINVYNAHTIKLIIDNYPVTSITKLKGGKPWDYKFIKLGDKTYTLNEIENDIIRPKFNEPRIHFAVNCAAKSCPKLMNKAWTEININSSLTVQTKAFLANTNENQLSTKTLKLSKIFEWYNADFTRNGSLISFIKMYSTTTINDDAKVSYNEYNWDLNE